MAKGAAIAGTLGLAAPALAPSGASGAGLVGSPALREAIQAGVDYALQPNKLNHLFADTGHKLTGLVEELGSREAVVRAAVQQLVGSDMPKEGTFEVVRQIADKAVTIRGAVVEGVPKIGTMFVQ